MGSIPSVSQRKIHHKFSPLGGDVSLRVCEHVGASLFVVYIAQLHRQVLCRFRVLDPGSCSCGSLTRGQSELPCTDTTMPGYNSWTSWTGTYFHANSPPGTRNCDEFYIEIRRESNPRGRELQSLLVSDPNHSANRVIRLVPNVPITCDGNIRY